MEEFLPIVLLSLAISGSSALLAALIGLPLAALLALGRFAGRGALVVAVNALLGLPPVVVGLVLFMAFSRPGPLGSLDWLFTPWAVICAETILAVPIVAALAHRALERRWAEYGRVMQASGAGRMRALPHLLRMARRPIATAVLAGFGRTISEVGAVQLVGGNIAGHTRTMTAAIALETGKGNLDLALGLGLALIGISVTVSATVLILTAGKRG